MDPNAPVMFPSMGDLSLDASPTHGMSVGMEALILILLGMLIVFGLLAWARGLWMGFCFFTCSEVPPFWGKKDPRTDAEIQAEIRNLDTVIAMLRKGNVTITPLKR